MQTNPPNPVAPVREYRSAAEFCGLPLVHVLFLSGPCSGGQRWARGWIAIGNRACGVLFAAGGIAVGGFAFGGLALGLITFGGLAAGAFAVAGLALGGLAYGGMAVGWMATGGLAIGWVAYGGCAVGWKAAMGGAAFAHEMAQGGYALAAHANDDLAREFFRDQTFFKQAPVWVKRIASPWTSFVVLGLAFLPAVLLRGLRPCNCAANQTQEEDAPPKL